MFQGDCVKISHYQTITDGLVGYWPFTDNASDESGNGNHGGGEWGDIDGRSVWEWD